MYKLGRGHREKVQQFMAITGVSEKVALQSLKASDWHLEGAFDVFYSQPQIKAIADSRHLEELYNRYKDPYVDMIMADGITLLCNDLQVDPQDIVMLVVSWHMKAATMCEFSKQEFIGGLQALGVDSLDKLREKLQFMRSELKDEQKFREIYNFAFAWAREKGQKSLALDTAIGMWQLLFAERHWPLVYHWCQFLQARHNKAISRDTWAQLLEFARVNLMKMTIGTGREREGLYYWEEAKALNTESSQVFQGVNTSLKENILLALSSMTLFFSILGAFIFSYLCF